MPKGKIIMLGLARPLFDIQLASELYKQSLHLLERLEYKVIHSGNLITDPDMAEKTLGRYRDRSADALIIQFSTFVDGRFIKRIAGQSNPPILLWSLPEPDVGGRLRLNSLTGLNAASNLLKSMKREFRYIHALPDDPDASNTIGIWLSAATTVRKLRESIIGEVGHPPPGFYISSIDPSILEGKIGPRLVHIDLDTLMQKARRIPPERYEKRIEQIGKIVKNLDKIDPDQLVKSIQFYLALKDTIIASNFNAVAIRCMPEMFEKYGAAACSTLSMLIEEGIPAACETDILGAVSMLMQYYLSTLPTYLGDLVHVDHHKNTAVFWHCGVGAFSLASVHTGPIAGVQPNRRYGFASNNALKSGPVTIMRLGRTDGNFRMFIARGEALDEPNRFSGTSVEVQFSQSIGSILDTVINGGFEFHFSLVWKDIARELKEVCSLLDIPTVAFL